MINPHYGAHDRPRLGIFGNELGQRVTAFGKAWRALFTAAGLPSDLMWHDARHEFVSSLIDEGGNTQEVKEAARHRASRRPLGT